MEKCTVLHPLNDVDKISFNNKKEDEFNLYKSFVMALEKQGLISENETIETLTIVRKKLGLPVIDSSFNNGSIT